MTQVPVRQGDTQRDPNGEARSPAETPAEENGEILTEDAPEPNLEELSRDALLEKVHALQGLADKNYDQYVRCQAEMENLKKRFARDRESLVRYANETLVRQMLPIVDNLRKALEHGDDNSIAALREGVELTLKGLLDALRKAGLEEVKALGERFDPNYHEAVSMRAQADCEPGVVLEELQTGYLLHDRLVRPAMVIVNQENG